MRPRTILIAAAAAVTFGFGLSVDLNVARWSAETGVTSMAEARWGVARRTTRRVARRTTRRVVRRSTIYAATLPAGCATVVVNGASLYQCGATYYQPYGGRYVVVYVD